MSLKISIFYFIDASLGCSFIFIQEFISVFVGDAFRTL